MEDSDTRAILPQYTILSADDYIPINDTFCSNEEVEKKGHKCSRRPPWPLSMQYLWDRISEDVGYNGTEGGGCDNTSGPPDPLQKEMETLTAHWNQNINLGGIAVGLFVAPGATRGAGGPCSSCPAWVLQAGAYLVVMYLKLPVAWFLLGRLLSGLSGDFNTILAGCFAYVAYISDRGSRTFRVVVLEACLGLAGMLASIIEGQWRRAQGYINPFWLVLATNLAAALYAYLFVPESVTPDPSAKLFTKWRRYKLWLYTFCFFLVVKVHFGSRELYVLYELSSPLCWGPGLIGWGSAAQNLAYFSSLLGLRTMQRCLEDSWVSLVRLASNMTGLVVISLANTTELMFT
ncbi:unnamed protein product, partial [Coregonus sp. 'balchen']